MRKLLVVPGLSKTQPAFQCMLLLVVILSCMLTLGACGPNPNDNNQPTPTVSSTLKIDTVLINLFVTYSTTQGSQEDKKNAAIQYARDNKILNNQDQAVFELQLDKPDRTQAVTDKVKTMGGTVRSTTAIEGTGTVKLRVSVPLDVFLTYASSTTKDNFLADLAAFDGVKSIDLIIGRQTQGLRNFPDSIEALTKLAQSTKNEGVKLMGADKWHNAGFKGQGVKIGIIDGGFKYYSKLSSNGILPPDLEPKDIDADVGGDGVLEADVHGSAVIEIIYSLAPAAQYFAAAVDGSDDEIKQGIDYLVAQGVSIISVSMGGHGTAGDGSSEIDKYIESVRKNKGVIFLFSAGNEGDAHYTDFFNPDANGFHQFVPGVTKLAVGNGSSSPFETFFILSWEQWGLSKSQLNDLDLFVTDSNGTVIKSSQNAQSARPPLEAVPVKLPPKQIYYIRVKQKPGTPAYTKPFRLHLFGHNTDFQFAVPQMAVADPASSKGAIAVGAIQWDEDKVAYYSSQGPLPDGRLKPEISAPAGVDSAAYTEDGGDVFDGTSAACPEAAGVTAILKGANPGLTVDQLEALLKESAKDLAPSGPDLANGYGRLNIGDLTPSGSVAPQGKAAPVGPIDVTNLHFPIQTLKFYPKPQVGAATAPKVAIPAPLPTVISGLANGPTDASRLPGGNQAPVATSAPNPTRAISTPPAVSNTPFRDTFRDISSGLANSGNALYQNGSYRVKAGGGQLFWSVYPTDLVNVTNFGAEITAQGITARDGIYGLVFWYQDNNNYYLLSVSGVGQYQVSQFSNGSYKELIGWTPAAGWKSSSSNNLRLVANQGNIGVIINNQNGKTASAKGQGSVGFAAGSYSGAVEAAYSDFKLSGVNK